MEESGDKPVCSDKNHRDERQLTPETPESTPQAPGDSDFRPQAQEGEATPEADPPRRLSARERAAQYRKQAYQRAKAANKAKRLEAKNSPAHLEYKARLKANRREAYLKAKQSRKSQRSSQRDHERHEADKERETRDAELMQTLVPATQVPPRLRLVRDGDLK